MYTPRVIVLEQFGNLAIQIHRFPTIAHCILSHSFILPHFLYFFYFSISSYPEYLNIWHSEFRIIEYSSSSRAEQHFVPPASHELPASPSSSPSFLFSLNEPSSILFTFSCSIAVSEYCILNRDHAPMSPALFLWKRQIMWLRLGEKSTAERYQANDDDSGGYEITVWIESDIEFSRCTFTLENDTPRSSTALYLHAEAAGRSLAPSPSFSSICIFSNASLSAWASPLLCAE